MSDMSKMTAAEQAAHRERISVERKEAQRRIDHAVRELRMVHAWAERDLRERLLGYIFGEAWDDVDPQDGRWSAAEFIVAGHLYATEQQEEPILAIQEALVELMGGIEIALAAGESLPGVQKPRAEIKRRANRVAELVSEWVDTVAWPEDPLPAPALATSVEDQKARLFHVKELAEAALDAVYETQEQQKLADRALAELRAVVTP